MPTRGVIAAGIVLMLAACASRVAPPAVPAVNKYPDFVYPTVPAALQQTPGAEHIEPGWRFLQSGDTRNAAREFQAAIKRNPRFYPAQAGDAYAAPARGDHPRALSAFDAATDRAGTPDVLIVGRQAARLLFGEANPVGGRLVDDLGTPLTAEVVGVTGDVRVFGQSNEAPPIVYLHARQHPVAFMQAVIRSSAPVADVTATLRSSVQALDPWLAISRVDRMERLVADSVAQPRFAMLLIGSFAGLALLLTTIGLYGTLAYLVSRRRREFGIRLAIGATRWDVSGMVLRQAAALVVAGVPAGVLGTVLAWPIVARFLAAAQPLDPVVVAGVAVGLAAVSLCAAFVPAHRAARVEPVVALRDE